MNDRRAMNLAMIRGTLTGLDEAERRTEHLMASNTEYPPLTEKQREAGKVLA